MNYFVIPLLEGRLQTAKANIALYERKLAELDTLGQRNGTQAGEYFKKQLTHWTIALYELTAVINILKSEHEKDRYNYRRLQNGNVLIETKEPGSGEPADSKDAE